MSNINRKTFLKGCTILAGASMFGHSNKLLAGDESNYIAEYASQNKNGQWKCQLCPNGCAPAEGQDGLCLARGVRDGKYRSLVHAYPCVISLDPVEKTPMYHYHVHGQALSIATAGCNLKCQYCQNWQFSQKGPNKTTNFFMKPKDVVTRALDMQAPTIAFFYTEPVIYIEYMKKVAVLAKKHNLKTIMVTGGSINEKPLNDLLPLIDMFVVGLKGFTQEFYSKIVMGNLKTVQNTLLAIKNAGKHFEVVTLLIPGMNDSIAHLKLGVDWFTKNLGTDVPWHFTRFVPEFKLKNLPPSPNEVLELARSMALKAGIKFVYTGNNPGQAGNNTYCPKCKKKVVERLGFQVMRSVLKKGICPDCGYKIPGVWLDDLPTGTISGGFGGE